jgi:uncharacterized RmlC-like cupin family protein
MGADVASVVALEGRETVSLMGPTIAFLVEGSGGDDAPCLLLGTVPAGGVVPLHSHADPETFILQAGEMEALQETGQGRAWATLRPGTIFHVPPNARHAFRNRTAEPAVALVVTTRRIARFFREIGTPPESRPQGPPPAAEVRRFLEVSARYGYWNASMEENAAVGLAPPGA